MTSLPFTSATDGLQDKDVISTSHVLVVSTESADKSQSNIVGIVVESFTLSIIWTFALLGNVLVCLVIHRSRRLQSTTNYFVVSLALTDLFLTLVCMPFIFGEFITARWVFGKALCKMVRFAELLSAASSMFVLVCICIDRYYSIIYPLSFKISRSRAKQMVLLSWSLGFITTCPALHFYDIGRTDDDSVYCTYYMTENKSTDAVFFVIFVSLMLYFVPMLTDACGYIKVCKFIWRAGVGGRTFQRTMNPVPRAKVKMVKMIMFVTAVHVSLVSPFFIMQLWHCSIAGNPSQGSTYKTAVFFLFITAMCKPCSYLCFNSNFRRGCKEVFCMSTMRCYRSQAYAITTTSKLGKKNHVGVILDQASRDHDSPARHFERGLSMDKAWSPSNITQSPSTYL